MCAAAALVDQRRLGCEHGFRDQGVYGSIREIIGPRRVAARVP